MTWRERVRRVRSRWIVAVSLTAVVGVVTLVLVSLLADGRNRSATNDASASLGFPIRASFLDVSFPTSWSRRGSEAFTRFEPALGLYDSADPSVVQQQLAWAELAGIEVFVVRWEARSDITDSGLQAIMALAEASPIRWVVYYQPEAGSDPDPDRIASDLSYLSERFFSRPNYLTIGGQSTLFVSARSDRDEMVTRWLDAEALSGIPLHVVLKVFPGFRESTDQPDSWHQFDPAVSYAEHLPYSALVSPGHWAPGDEPRLERDPVRFEADVRAMVASGANWQLVETWNDWGEGTSVEPSTEYGTVYLDILARHRSP